MNYLTSRAILLLAGATIVACTAEPDESGTSFGSDTATATATSTSSTGGSTTLQPSTGDETSTSATDDSGGSTSGGGSSGEPEPECGNGVVEGDEECDDGNDSELDACLTTCIAPACDDGELNGDETDVDCGGSCGTCTLCQACVVDGDCESAVCNVDKFCGFTARMEIDAVDNCWSSTMFANNVVIMDVPMGTYRATAVQSGWAGFPPPWNPPDTGWTWYAECIGVTFQQLRTPGQERYANASQAFSNLLATTEDFQWLGGDFSCGRQDTVCDDNMGSVIFDIDLMCPDPMN